MTDGFLFSSITEIVFVHSLKNGTEKSSRSQKPTQPLSRIGFLSYLSFFFCHDPLYAFYGEKILLRQFVHSRTGPVIPVDPPVSFTGFLPASGRLSPAFPFSFSAGDVDIFSVHILLNQSHHLGRQDLFRFSVAHKDLLNIFLF